MKIPRPERQAIEARAVEAIRAHYSGQHEDEHAVAVALDNLRLLVALEMHDQRLRGITPIPGYRYAEGGELVTPRRLDPGADEPLPAVVLMGWGEVVLQASWQALMGEHGGKFATGGRSQHGIEADATPWLSLSLPKLPGRYVKNRGLEATERESIKGRPVQGPPPPAWRGMGHEERLTVRLDGGAVILARIRCPKVGDGPDGKHVHVHNGQVVVPACRLELEAQSAQRRTGSREIVKVERIPGTTRRRLGKRTVVGRPDRPTLEVKRSGRDVRAE